MFRTITLTAMILGTSASALPLDRHSCIIALNAVVEAQNKTTETFDEQIAFLRSQNLNDLATSALKAKAATLADWQEYERALAEHCRPRF